LVGVLSCSADAKSLRLAEEVLQYCRSQHRMTVAVYSAMTKVYAYCGLHDRACDLYPEVFEQGFVPDSIM
jgi:pentatricopeptide repeat protein